MRYIINTIISNSYVISWRTESPLKPVNYTSLINDIGFWCLSGPQIGTQVPPLSGCTQYVPAICLGMHGARASPIPIEAESRLDRHWATSLRTRAPSRFPPQKETGIC